MKAGRWFCCRASAFDHSVRRPAAVLLQIFQRQRSRVRRHHGGARWPVTYQEAKDDDNPIHDPVGQCHGPRAVRLSLKSSDRFQRPLESGLKIANLGTKTFRFEDGAEHHEIQFNYSEDLTAQALLDCFERITETEQHFANLDRTAHFEKLGVNDVLLQMQSSWEHNRLVAPEQFLPLLDRIAKNESYLHIARERAAPSPRLFASRPPRSADSEEVARANFDRGHRATFRAASISVSWPVCRKPWAKPATVRSNMILAIEDHLKEYPNSPERAELERALVKTAMDLNDDQRLMKYGESVLSRDPNNVQVLEHVTTALLHQGRQGPCRTALEHARHLADLIQATYQNDKFEPGGGAAQLKRKDDYDRGRARALLLQARAQGLLGHNQEAIQLAQSSYSIFPSVESARELARWLSAAGKDAEAIQAFAEAFTIAGLRSADPEGGSDRARMSELYRKLHGSEAGLGDLILKTYDSTSAQLAARRAELHQIDPNAQLSSPIQFTLSGLNGDKLQLSSLLGKVIVLDFWATWCVPCREQHPLYEKVKSKFKDSGDVVFLAVDTDEDHSLVKPFLPK